ncbi:MAG: membrane protein insertion efficiency factor YidD [Candidatus Shapirobacteria bacterium]
MGSAQKIVLKILVFYKKYVSRGENCRFIPNCSEYAYEAIEKKGVVRGGWLAIKRVVRCRPGGGGGIDLLQ